MPDLFKALPASVSLQRQIQAVEREIAMRRRVYARRVEQRAMRPQQADEEIAVMEAVLATLQGVNRSAG